MNVCMNYKKMLEYDKIDIAEGLTLIKQINQKNVCFVITGIF